MVFTKETMIWILTALKEGFVGNQTNTSTKNPLKSPSRFTYLLAFKKSERKSIRQLRLPEFEHFLKDNKKLVSQRDARRAKCLALELVFATCFVDLSGISRSTERTAYEIFTSSTCSSPVSADRTSNWRAPPRAGTAWVVSHGTRNGQRKMGVQETKTLINYANCVLVQMVWIFYQTFPIVFIALQTLRISWSRCCFRNTHIKMAL